MLTKAKDGFTQPRLQHRLLLTYTEPTSVKQAFQVPEWKEAMQAEYDALLANNTCLWFLYLLTGLPLAANGCFVLSKILMAL
jgi:hypothetical protein